MNRVNDATKAIGTTQQNIDDGQMIPAASNGLIINEKEVSENDSHPGISDSPRPEYCPFNCIIEASDAIETSQPIVDGAPNIHAVAIGFISHENEVLGNCSAPINSAPPVLEYINSIGKHNDNDGASTNVSDDETTDMVPNSPGFNSDQRKNDKSVPESNA
ncbi:hypothetical protein C1H46_004690 [Malus baccata]|uniref:Uncharacterized protein n=1 Tax=Malus baccata TaxID=106549 RepID=A0A540NGI8_MALBA|nr:hypothetical protein C1H46_004690 [Malus baccata]